MKPDPRIDFGLALLWYFKAASRQLPVPPGSYNYWFVDQEAKWIVCSRPMTQTKIKGSCLCNSVSVEIDKNPETFTVCHCEDCRRWSGGVPMSINAGEHLEFSGKEFIGRYSSSNFAERGFCKKCGSHLFFRLVKTDHYFLLVGLFGDDISPKFELQEFIDRKPDFYSFANETKTLTKAEAFKMLENYLSRP